MKKLIPLISTILIITLIFCVKNYNVYAIGENYYIDSEKGNDNNSGVSESSPWLTFNNVNTRTLNPGDHVYLKRGGYWRQNLVINGQGSYGNLIEVGAYGSGPRPVIDGQGMTDFKCIYWNNAGYGRVSNITVMNAGMGVFLFGNGSGLLTVEDVVSINIRGRYNDGAPQLAFSFGIAIYGTWGHQITIKNCDVSGGGSGIIAWGSTVPIIIDNCYIHDAYVPKKPDIEDSTGMDGLHLSHAPYKITNCVLDNCTYKAPLGTTGILFAYYDGAIKSEMKNCIIENIKNYGSTDQCAIDFEDDYNNIEISNCTFKNNAGAAIELLDDTRFNHDINVTNCNFYKNNSTAYHGFKSEISVIETGVLDLTKQPWVKTGDPGGIRHSANFTNNVFVPCTQGHEFLQGDTKETGFPIIDRASDLSEIRVNNLQNKGINGTISYNNHPIISAGVDLAGKKINTPFQLSGSATDDGGTPTITWEQVTGPGIATFSNTSIAKPTITLPKEGDYLFRMISSDGTYTVSSFINVTTSIKSTISSKPYSSFNTSKVNSESNSSKVNSEFNSSKSSITTNSSENSMTSENSSIIPSTYSSKNESSIITSGRSLSSDSSDIKDIDKNKNKYDLFIVIASLCLALILIPAILILLKKFKRIKK